MRSERRGYASYSGSSYSSNQTNAQPSDSIGSVVPGPRGDVTRTQWTEEPTLPVRAKEKEKKQDKGVDLHWGKQKRLGKCVSAFVDGWASVFLCACVSIFAPHTRTQLPCTRGVLERRVMVAGWQSPKLLTVHPALDPHPRNRPLYRIVGTGLGFLLYRRSCYRSVSALWPRLLFRQWLT